MSVSFRPVKLRSWFALLPVLLLLILLGIRWKEPPEKSPAQDMLSARLLAAYSHESSPAEMLRLLETAAVPRVQVDRLTTPPGYESTGAGGRLVFAHLADGAIPGQNRSMKTSFTFSNDSIYTSIGTLRFYSNDGSPLTLTIGGKAVTSLPITVEAGKLVKLTTAGTGSVKSGWALLTSDQPLAGTSSFSVSDTKGAVFTDVGVEESLLKSEFTLFADTKGNANTGIALVNPDAAANLNLTLELYNPNGTLKKSRSLTLGPRNHLAQFLDELFAGTPGITDFEGSLLVKGNLHFGGITLRSVDSLLTSVPMVFAPNLRTVGNQLEFPQVADGSDGSLKIVTSVVLINNTDKLVSGSLDFVQSDGAPMVVSIAGHSGSSFPYSLPSKGATRFLTQAKSAIKTGWARVSKDGPISGCAIYHILNQAGSPLTEVGISAAPRRSTLNALVDSIGNYRTGLALANVDEEEDEIDISITLFNDAGSPLTKKTVSLPKGTQRPVFLDELFSDVTGIQEFQGRAVVSCSDAFVALTLRQNGLLTTSVPTLDPLFGFTPTTVVGMAQNLVGTSPSLRIQMAQSGSDLTLSQMALSIPDVGVNLASVTAGDEVGYGCFFLDLLGSSTGGIIKLIATDSGGVTFDLVGSMQSTAGAVLMAGRLSGQPAGGFRFELGPPQPPNNQDYNNLVGFEIDLTLKDGLLKLPSKAGEITVTGTHNSTSSKLNEDGVSIVRTTRQKLTVATPGAGTPQLLSTRPTFFSPGDQLVLTGSNFGASPRVFFWTGDGGQTEAFAPTVDGSTVSASVPSDARDGSLIVMNGAVSSNSLISRTLFSPESEISAVPGVGSNFTTTLKSTIPERQLAFAKIIIRLYQVGWPVVNPDGEGLVGTMVVKGGASSSSSEAYSLGLESSSADRIRLFVRDSDDEIVGHLDVDRAQGEVTPGLIFTYALDTPLETPQVNGFPVEIDWNLPGLAMSRSPADGTVYWSAELVSCPSDLYGSETGISTLQDMTNLD